MAANTNPIFGLTINTVVGQVSVANTARDGTGTLVTLNTGGTDATRINKIQVTATVTTTAGMIRFFVFNGTNTRLWKEVPVTAATPSGTVESFKAELSRSDGQPLLTLPATWELRVSTNNAETFNILSEGENFS